MPGGLSGYPRKRFFHKKSSPHVGGKGPAFLTGGAEGDRDEFGKAYFENRVQKEITTSSRVGDTFHHLYNHFPKRKT